MVCSHRVAGGIECKCVSDSVEKGLLPGWQTLTLSRPTHQEIFISATAAPGESAAALFGRIAAGLDELSARVVSLEAFGLEARTGRSALCGAMGEPSFPITWLEEGCEETPVLAGVQVWAVTDLEIEPVLFEGRIVGSLFEDGCVRTLRLGGLGALDSSLPKAEQSRLVFGQMEQILAQVGMDFSNVARTWFYNDKIVSWYGDFNKVRSTFFKEHQVFDRLVPASTGVGGRNNFASALTAGLLAVVPICDAARIFAVPSPLQCPALEYGSAFSRAVEIALPDYRRLLISGTASIAPEGHTVHIDDTYNQIVLTMEVVAGILESRGMTWNDVSRAIGYFKHHADAPAWARYVAEHNLPEFPTLIVKEEICRDDLLFEIELDAVTLG